MHWIYIELKHKALHRHISGAGDYFSQMHYLTDAEALYNIAAAGLGIYLRWGSIIPSKLILYVYGEIVVAQNLLLNRKSTVEALRSGRLITRFIQNQSNV